VKIRGYEGLLMPALTEKKAACLAPSSLKVMRNLTDVITVVQFGKAHARPTAEKAGSEEER
jgi:hypothetical protein